MLDFSLHCWIVQRGPGQHVHILPEQQCQRGQLVDVHLHHWLLAVRQRLHPRLHQYVVVRYLGNLASVIALATL